MCVTWDLMTSPVRYTKQLAEDRDVAVVLRTGLVVRGRRMDDVVAVLRMLLVQQVAEDGDVLLVLLSQADLLVLRRLRRDAVVAFQGLAHQVEEDGTLLRHLGAA